MIRYIDGRFRLFIRRPGKGPYIMLYPDEKRMLRSIRHEFPDAWKDGPWNPEWTGALLGRKLPFVILRQVPTGLFREKV